MLYVLQVPIRVLHIMRSCCYTEAPTLCSLVKRGVTYRNIDAAGGNMTATERWVCLAWHDTSKLVGKQWRTRMCSHASLELALGGLCDQPLCSAYTLDSSFPETVQFHKKNTNLWSIQCHAEYVIEFRCGAAPVSSTAPNHMWWIFPCHSWCAHSYTDYLLHLPLLLSQVARPLCHGLWWESFFYNNSSQIKNFLLAHVRSFRFCHTV